MRNIVNSELTFVSGGNGEELRVSTMDMVSYNFLYNEVEPLAPFRVVRSNDSIVEPISAFYNEEDVA